MRQGFFEVSAVAGLVDMNQLHELEVQRSLMGCQMCIMLVQNISMMYIRHLSSMLSELSCHAEKIEKQKRAFKEVGHPAVRLRAALLPMSSLLLWYQSFLITQYCLMSGFSSALLGCEVFF